MRIKYILLVITLIIVALFAVYVWPTRYIYTSEKIGEYTHVIRIDRFSDRAWVLTPQGWRERVGSNPIDDFLSDQYAKYGGKALPAQTSQPLTSSVAPAIPPQAKAPEPKPKRWAMVNDDTSIFKPCHFEAGSRTNPDGCDFVMADSD